MSDWLHANTFWLQNYPHSSLLVSQCWSSSVLQLATPAAFSLDSVYFTTSFHRCWVGSLEYWYICMCPHFVTTGCVEMLSLSLARSIWILKRFPSGLNSVTPYYLYCIYWCGGVVTQGRKRKKLCQHSAWLHSSAIFELRKLSNSHRALKTRVGLSW